MLLETNAAQHGSALRRFEGNRGFSSTLGARRPCLRANLLVSAQTLGFALLATLRVVFKLLIVEEYLFASGKYKLGATVNAR